MIILLNNDAFGRNLKTLRKKYCLSQKALAKLTHISTCRLKDIEEGFEKDIDAQWLLRICSIFEMSESETGRILSELL